MIAISAGHWKIGTGAKDLIDEVIEARRVAYEVSKQLEQLGCQNVLIIDDTSRSKRENLTYLVKKHRLTAAKLHVSIHFNSVAGGRRETAIGTETLYKDTVMKELAAKISIAISQAGNLKNRGAKCRKDLYFLNHFAKNAILIEVCFVNSNRDVQQYMQNFLPICKRMALVLDEWVRKNIRP